MKDQYWKQAAKRFHLMRTVAKINRAARLVSTCTALLGILFASINIIGLVRTIPGR